MPGSKRFSELSRAIGGITQRMLTLQLRELEEAGIVRRTLYAEVPPRVDYALTQRGQSLQPVLIAMRDWGLRYVQEQLHEDEAPPACEMPRSTAAIPGCITPAVPGTAPREG